MADRSPSRNSEPKPVTAPQEDRTTWARYWTHWYNKHMAEAAEAKRLAESYGASFPSETPCTVEFKTADLPRKEPKILYDGPSSSDKEEQP